MAVENRVHHALGDAAARQLANATKTVPQLSTISPRWLVHFLQWLPVEAGIYRLNTVKNPQDVRVSCSQREDEGDLPEIFVDYEDQPREYFLNAVTTVLDVHTRISDLYSSPHDQIKEQLRLTVETVKERQESELINNPDYGLLANVADEQRISTLTGAPTVRLAHRSGSGRHSPIRGTIHPFSAAQVSTKRPQARNTSHKQTRATTESVLRVLVAGAIGAGL